MSNTPKPGELPGKENLADEILQNQTEISREIERIRGYLDLMSFEGKRRAIVDMYRTSLEKRKKGLVDIAIYKLVKEIAPSMMKVSSDSKMFGFGIKDEDDHASLSMSLNESLNEVVKQVSVRAPAPNTTLSTDDVIRASMRAPASLSQGVPSLDFPPNPKVPRDLLDKKDEVGVNSLTGKKFSIFPGVPSPVSEDETNWAEEMKSSKRISDSKIAIYALECAKKVVHEMNVNAEHGHDLSEESACVLGGGREEPISVPGTREAQLNELIGKFRREMKGIGDGLEIIQDYMADNFGMIVHIDLSRGDEAIRDFVYECKNDVHSIHYDAVRMIITRKLNEKVDEYNKSVARFMASGDASVPKKWLMHEFVASANEFVQFDEKSMEAVLITAPEMDLRIEEPVPMTQESHQVSAQEIEDSVRRDAVLPLSTQSGGINVAEVNQYIAETEEKLAVSRMAITGIAFEWIKEKWNGIGKRFQQVKAKTSDVVGKIGSWFRRRASWVTVPGVIGLAGVFVANHPGLKVKGVVDSAIMSQSPVPSVVDSQTVCVAPLRAAIPSESVTVASKPAPVAANPSRAQASRIPHAPSYRSAPVRVHRSSVATSKISVVDLAADTVKSIPGKGNQVGLFEKELNNPSPALQIHQGRDLPVSELNTAISAYRAKTESLIKKMAKIDQKVVVPEFMAKSKVEYQTPDKTEYQQVLDQLLPLSRNLKTSGDMVQANILFNRLEAIVDGFALTRAKAILPYYGRQTTDQLKLVTTELQETKQLLGSRKPEFLLKAPLKGADEGKFREYNVNIERIEAQIRRLSAESRLPVTVSESKAELNLQDAIYWNKYLKFVNYYLKYEARNPGVIQFR